MQVCGQGLSFLREMVFCSFVWKKRGHSLFLESEQKRWGGTKSVTHEEWEDRSKSLHIEVFEGLLTCPLVTRAGS